MKKYTQICLNEIKKETEKAILVEGIWLPKSQLLVALNNQYYDYNTNTIKEYKEKSMYCLLLPLWLHIKNNMSYKKSQSLQDWLIDFNTDMRTDIKYEAIKVINYFNYKEGK